MTTPAQILAIVVSLGLLITVLELVRRRQLTEEFSFIWILCSAALVLLSVWSGLLDAAARWIGIYYPPTVLLLLLLVAVFVSALFFSVVISRQRAQISQLIEETAVLAARLRDVENGRPPRAS